MMVYVCLSEYDGEHSVEEVYKSLDYAQLRMRTELELYLARCRENGYEPCISWYKGNNNHWGWYDDCEPYGFRIHGTILH